jgi:hypothetical protein
MSPLNSGQLCERCGGAPSRAVRTRRVADAETVYYLAFNWACSVCGNSWVDNGLERMNAQAEQAARRQARRLRFVAQRAS